MSRTLSAAGAAVLIAGPTVIAFFSGGFFDDPRLLGALVAWVLVGLAALVARRPLPRTTSGRCALLGLALLAVWTALSVTWAPLGSRAEDDAQRMLLYLGAFTAGVALLDQPWVRRQLEPLLALGALRGDRLRPRGAPPSRAGGAGPQPHLRRAARAARHLLERGGCHRGHRPGARRSRRRRSAPASGGPVGGGGRWRGAGPDHLSELLPRRARRGRGGAPRAAGARPRRPGAASSRRRRGRRGCAGHARRKRPGHGRIPGARGPGRRGRGPRHARRADRALPGRRVARGPRARGRARAAPQAHARPCHARG